MKNKTIVILSQVNFDNSPYTSYTHYHAVELVNLGYKVIVLASVTIKPGVDLNKYTGVHCIDGVDVIYFRRIGFSNILYKSKINLNAISYYMGCRKIIKRIFDKYNVVLIDAHTFKVQGVVASYLKRKYGVTTFVTSHGTSLNRNLQFENGVNSIKKVAKLVDYMVCVSEKQERALCLLGIKNTKVIYNGAISYNNKIDNNNYNIISVGYFTKVKNFDKVIMAFAKVVKEVPSARLTIVGDGVLRDDLIRQATDLNVSQYVCFTGALSNDKVNELLSKSNVFVLPSSPEGFGITYVEAMNNGCIVIGTRGEGIDGFVKDGVNGFLTNVDVDEISDKILYIFNNNCDKIRKTGIRDAKMLTWKNNAKKYIELLGETNEEK